MSTEPVPVPVPSLYLGVCRHRHTPRREAVSSVPVPGHTKRAHLARRLGNLDTLERPRPLEGATFRGSEPPETHYYASTSPDADYCASMPSREAVSRSFQPSIEGIE